MTYRPNYYGAAVSTSRGQYRNTTIALLPETYKKLDQMAFKHNISRGALGRALIEHLVNDERLVHHIIMSQVKNEPRP